MALPTDNSFEATPAYLIYRDSSNGEPADPTSPLLFFPPKHSDELFDALRSAFPQLKTHTERMRDAIIQFLLQERQEEQFQTSPALTVDTTAPTWPSTSSSGSTSVFSSPEIFDLPSPTSFANTPQMETPQLARNASVATSSQASPPSLDQMTGVFSLSAEAQPKQRVRRKMTEVEKVEYRKRRIVKACDKCAKRKRKCPHNQAQMEVVQTSKSGAKVAKAVSRKSNFDIEKKGQNYALAEPVLATQDFDFTAGLDMSSFQSFDDFPMFEDPFPEFTVDDLMHFDQPANNFQPQDYFTHDLSPSQQSGSSGNLHYEFDVPQPLNPAQHVPSATGDPQLLDQDGNHSNEGSSAHGSQQRPRRSGMRVSTGAETRNNVLREVNHQEGDLLRRGDLQDRRPDGQHDGQQNIPSHGVLWGHLRTGQQETPQPTHTAHVHNAGQGELFGLAEANGVLKELRRGPTLAQATLQLVGTAKALRTFARLARSTESSSPSQTRPISMQCVSDALRHATELRHSTSNGSTPLQVQHTRPRSGTSSLSDSALRKSLDTRISDRREGLLAHTANVVQQERRLQTSTSVSQSGGLRIGTAALSQGRPQLSLIKPDHGIQQSLLSSGSTSATATSVPQQQDRRSTTLGKGIAPLSSISTELFMLRRRIPRKPGINQNHQHTTKVKVESGQLAVQANGGAYPRLQPRDAHAASNDSGRTPAIAATPASIVGTYAVAGAKTVDRSMAAQANFTLAPAPEQARASDHMLCRDHHGRSPQQDRLRDYFKVKDHRGRSAPLAVLAIFTLVAMLFASSLLTVVFSAVCYLSFSSFEKEELVQCTETNSSWLTSIARSKSKSEGFSSKKGKEFGTASRITETWLKVLMYPFAYSPLRFATMV